MQIGKFKSQTAGTTAVRKSRFAGVQAAAPRAPMLCAPGTYRVRVVACELGTNPGKGTDSFKTTFEIVDLDENGAKNHAPGETAFMVDMLSGPGGPSGLSRNKTFVMAAAGFDDENEFDAFDPDGGFRDALTGAANEYSQRGDTIIGRLVDVQVTRGNMNADGSDYYRVYAWGVVGEDEQTVKAPGR